MSKCGQLITYRSANVFEVFCDLVALYCADLDAWNHAELGFAGKVQLNKYSCCCVILPVACGYKWLRQYFYLQNSALCQQEAVHTANEYFHASLLHRHFLPSAVVVTFNLKSDWFALCTMFVPVVVVLVVLPVFDLAWLKMSIILYHFVISN